jgi:serine/threonine protein kinase
VGGACTAKVIDADVDDPHPYLVTEYVPGPTLSGYIEDHGPLEGSQLTAFAVALAEALSAIHRAGVIHRIDQEDS